MRFAQNLMVVNVTIATVCLLAAVRSARGEERPRGWIDGPCSGCSPHGLIVNQGTRIRYGCVSRLSGRVVRVPEWDPPPVIAQEIVFDCDNCWNPCSTLNCEIGGRMSETDVGTVSSDTVYAVELKREVNAILAAAIGIQATAEFHAGVENSTSVTREFEAKCSTEAPRCRRIWISFKVYSAPRVAWQPIEHIWYFSTCNGNIWTGCSEWRQLNSCGTVGHARIDGSKGYRGTCESRPLKCENTPPCLCEPVGPPAD